MLAVLAFNLVGDALRDLLDPRLRGEQPSPLEDVHFVATILPIPCEERYGPLAMTPQR